jgi:hypothetical protein
MSYRPESVTDCRCCVWWVAGEDEGSCAYRETATASNMAWRQIRIGRCTHYLVAADAVPPPVGDAGE